MKILSFFYAIIFLGDSMKRLLFTHIADIDGMGGAILSKLAFDNIDIIYCKNPSDLNSKIIDNYENNNLYNYNLIYISDLSPNRELLEKLLNDVKLSNKIYLFDHHETAFNAGLNDFDNCIVRVSEGDKTSCATQIYYEFLVNNGFLKSNNILDQFVELVRLEDTYEYKKYNREDAHDLAILFNSIGMDEYINRMINKIKNNDSFSFDEYEIKMINNKKEMTIREVESFLKYVKVLTIDGFKVGICFIKYEYRNEVCEYLINHNSDLDCIAMFAFENNQISLRSIKDNSSARIIAEKFGGGGHDKAAAIGLDDSLKDKIVNSIFGDMV